MHLEQILSAAIRGGASDIVLKTGAVPRFRFNGQLVPLANGEVIRPELMTAWVTQLYPQKQDASPFLDLDFAYQNRDGHRFRVNVFKQRGLLGIVLRVILGHIRTLEELQLPQIISKLTKEHRGLVLVTGATGSGKSTTLAAMIEKINTDSQSHIITIEDPIELLFQDKNSVVEQREVGVDTKSFSKAIRSALRQNPNVIMVGELRDRTTVMAAIQAAETGHLVLSTLHTADSIESINRILSFFASDSQAFVRQVLAQVLRAVISQRLVTRRKVGGMVPAVEILIGTHAVKEAILRGEIHTLRDLIREGQDAWGMQSFDQSLAGLCRNCLISADVALENATSRGNMELELSGVSAK
ncbi:MAG: PilT/PilU family type 4a pilus ATPase [Proteobacteria bacterium]|nr:PilT/PilU family type 4a pilus ATPase [Pseudomonadota bacterium]